MCGIDIEVRRSRRKTMSLEVTGEARVIVRAPYNMPTAEIKKFVTAKKDWIVQKQQEVSERKKQRQEISDGQLRELSRNAARILPGRAAYFAGIVGVDYGRITIRRQRTRWGSCSSKGNLNFNCLLMLMPPEIQDYVVVHELCHRKEMNHSARFWNEVGRVLPDYRERREWLKKNGSYLSR